MTFEQAVEHILEMEGGYVNDPSDPGGETRFGISKRSYPALDIRSLTRHECIEIYKRDFWDRLKIGQMPGEIRLAVFDCAVNQGAGFASTSLQRACGAEPDGIIGPATLAAAAAMDPLKLKRDLLIMRMRSYSTLSNWYRFGAGWAMRLIKVATS